MDTNTTNVIEINEPMFEAEVISSDKPVLVDFWAPWCGPCRVVAPVVEQLANLYSDKVKFVKVNTDDNQRLAGQYTIRGIPTLIFFVNGEEKLRFVGARSKEEFEAGLSGWLK